MEENKEEARSLSQFSTITDNNTSEHDNGECEESKEQQVILSDFIREHDLLPTPHEGATTFRNAYLEMAISLWKPRYAQPRADPASISEYIFNYKTSENLYNNKGKGKFPAKKREKGKSPTKKFKLHDIL